MYTLHILHHRFSLLCTKHLFVFTYSNLCTITNSVFNRKNMCNYTISLPENSKNSTKIVLRIDSPTNTSPIFYKIRVENTCLHTIHSLVYSTSFFIVFYAIQITVFYPIITHFCYFSALFSIFSLRTRAFL